MRLRVLIRTGVAMLVAAVAIVACTPSDEKSATRQRATTASPAPALTPESIAAGPGLSQPVTVRATVDGVPIDLSRTKTYCDLRPDQFTVMATGPVGVRTASVKIETGTNEPEVIISPGNLPGLYPREKDPSAPPVKVTREGTVVRANGTLYTMTQRGWGTAHAFTIDALCTAAPPVRTPVIAQPVAIAATLDGQQVDLRNTIPVCARAPGDEYFTIAASGTRWASPDSPSLYARINHSSLVVSHGGIRGHAGHRDFRGDGPSSGESWRMHVTRDGTVYRVTGVDDVSGGTLEIVADCAGI